MKSTAFFTVLILIISLGTAMGQQTTKYVFVDADCKEGFEVLPGVSDKRIVTEIKAFEFEDPAQALFAEDHIKSEFKAIIQQQYPGSMNQFKGIYVYMLNEPDVAKEKRESLTDDYKDKGIALIDLEL